MPTPRAVRQWQPTDADVERALRTFIKSGSASGVEEMRSWLLKRVKVMVNALKPFTAALEGK